MGVIHTCSMALYRFAASITLVCMLAGGSYASEVILTSENLNETLKQMQRIRQGIENTAPEVRANGLYQLGVLANNLADLLSEEIALYDSQQGGLIQIGLDRTKELGLDLIWMAEKKRFIYDGKVFEEYMELAPTGRHAADSAFQVLQNEFVRAVIDDPAALKLAAEHKSEYLNSYPQHEQAAEVGILLAIDYRDLWRLYQAGSDSENAALYREQTLKQFRRVIEQHAGAKQAKIAEGLLARFETELQALANESGQQPAE